MSAEDIVLYSSIGVGAVGIVVGLATLQYSRYKGIGTALGIAETVLEGAGLYFAVQLVADSRSPVYKWGTLIPVGCALMISILYMCFSFSEQRTTTLASFETRWYAAGSFIIILAGVALIGPGKLEKELALLAYAGASFNIGLYVLIKFTLKCCSSCVTVKTYVLKAVSNVLTGISVGGLIFFLDYSRKVELVPLIVLFFSRAVDYYGIFKDK